MHTRTAAALNRASLPRLGEWRVFSNPCLRSSSATSSRRGFQSLPAPGSNRRNTLSTSQGRRTVGKEPKIRQNASHLFTVGAASRTRARVEAFSIPESAMRTLFLAIFFLIYGHAPAVLRPHFRIASAKRTRGLHCKMTARVGDLKPASSAKKARSTRKSQGPRWSAIRIPRRRRIHHRHFPRGQADG